MPKNNSIPGKRKDQPVIDPFIRKFLVDVADPKKDYSVYVSAGEWNEAVDALLKMCQLTQKLFVERGNMTYLDVPSRNKLKNELTSIIELTSTNPINESGFSPKQAQWVSRAVENISQRYEDVVSCKELTFQPS